MLRLLDAQASMDVVESESEVVRPLKYPRISKSEASMDVVESEKIDKFVEGSKVNLVRLLSSRDRDYLVDAKGKKVKVSTLEGNYVMIYCFPIPLVGSSRMNIYFALKTALSIWQNQEIYKFKLVVVPQMSPGSGSDDFNNFLSYLPSCLAIPISDSVSCHRLCRSMKPYGSLILDLNQRVSYFSYCGFLNYFVHESYPFTYDHIQSLWEKLGKSMNERPVHLDRLLGLDPLDCLGNADGNSIPISQLKEKVVGLYLFVCGNLKVMSRINQIFQECKALDRALEIVVVHVPLGRFHQTCFERSDAAFKKMGISSWWISPFKDTASRKLWWLRDGYDSDVVISDSFMIVGPNGKYLERTGLAACLALPYPYDAEHFALEETEKLKKLSRDAFLADCFPVANPGKRIQLGDLQKKNVIFFIGLCDDFNFDKTLAMIKIWCEFHQCREESNIRLVFVPLDASKNFHLSDPKMSWISDPAMSWLTCAPESIIQKKIIELTALRHLARRDVLSFITFGEEGQIVSIAHPALSSCYYEANASLRFSLLKLGDDGKLHDQLYKDVLDTVEDLVDDMSDYELLL